MRVQLSLGANLGDRAKALRMALGAIEKNGLGKVCAVSSVWETAPWDASDQPMYWNIAAEIETALEPLEFLNAVKVIERSMGRTPGERWGPRTIDIDIVLWGDLRVATPELTLPHQAFRKRAFVLAPLAEIAADAVDPVTGRQVRELLEAPEAKGAVTKLFALD